MRAMIVAGGTGGHVFPALAVAERLRELGHEVFWMGTESGLEARVVPARGIDIEWVRVAGLRGKGVGGLLQAPLRISRALLQSLAIVRRRRPDVVLGMGGYVAGPGGVAAWMLRKPLVIHEQNAAPGTTNRILASFANRVLQAFPHALKGGATVGNPVRAGFSAVPEPAVRFAGREGRLRLLVLGGSQGALALNERVPQALALLPPEQRPQVRHQAGRTIERAEQAYRQAGVEAGIEAFIEDMPAAYAWADLVVCRSGAMTVAELAAAGCASLLVPFPYATDDHQTHNGEYLVSAGAAWLIAESSLSPERLADALQVERSTLLRMSEAARAAAWPQALDTIVETLVEEAGR